MHSSTATSSTVEKYYNTRVKGARHFFVDWLLVLLWAAFIFYLSSVPHLRFLDNTAWDFIVRKIGHMGVFGILARLLARAFMGSTFWSWKKIFAASLILSCVYACTDEYHQSFVSGRHASASDVLIDTFGSWVALGLTP